MLNDQRPLVVAVSADGDDEALLRFAVREALLRGCPVRLVHARRDGDREAARRRVETAIARAEVLAGPGVLVTATLVDGEPVAGVLGGSGDTQGVLVRQRDVLHLMRAICEDRRPARDPLVTCVPTTWSVVPEDDRPFVVGVDDPEAAHDLVVQALEVARVHETSLRVLHAWHFPGRYDDLIGDRVGDHWHEDVRRTVGAAVARCQAEIAAEVPVEVVVEHGVPAELLVQAARHAQGVLLERNRVGTRAERVGRATRTALHECPCPVTLLPPRPARP